MNYDDYKTDNPFHQKDCEPDYDAIFEKSREDKRREAERFRKIAEYHDCIQYLIRDEFDKCDPMREKFLIQMAIYFGYHELAGEMERDSQ